MTMKKKQKGFTLVELSIVLVIIGLIIGGVLTGQQIIQNARVTNAINGIQAYQAQFQTYAQNYGALPGDDSSASARFPSLGESTDMNGDGDGKVGTSSSFDTQSTTDTAGESRLVWAHLRAADLVKNQVSSGSTAVQPSNPFGGIYGFQDGAWDVFSTTALCLNRVPSDAAQAIDSRLDDGAGDAGAIQSVVYSDDDTASTDVVSVYQDGETYTMCVRM